MKVEVDNETSKIMDKIDDEFKTVIQEEIGQTITAFEKKIDRLRNFVEEKSGKISELSSIKTGISEIDSKLDQIKTCRDEGVNKIQNELKSVISSLAKSSEIVDLEQKIDEEQKKVDSIGEKFDQIVTNENFENKVKDFKDDYSKLDDEVKSLQNELEKVQETLNRLEPIIAKIEAYIEKPAIKKIFGGK